MGKQISAVPDTWLSFCKEARPDAGEDNFCRAFTKTAGLIAVFDGCGGSGARRHPFYSDKTEAYMASRLCAGAFYDAFSECFSGKKSVSATAFAETAAQNCATVFGTYQPPKDNELPQIGGSLMKVLPTTAATVLVRPKSEKLVEITAIWAGDSRAYLMDANGLAQLTVDDTGVTDPFENLYDDGIMRNIICAGKPVKLHTKTLEAQKPFLVLTATDGCFGYYSTPMEFEAVLLDTLLQSKNSAQWETMLSDRIGKVAGDDYTMCLAAYGYSGFDQLQRSFSKRLQFLNTEFIQFLRELPVTDRDSRRTMWKQYQTQYMRYLKDE